MMTNHRVSDLATALLAALVFATWGCGGDEEDVVPLKLPPPQESALQQAQQPKIVPKTKEPKEEKHDEPVEVPEGHELLTLGPNANEFKLEPAKDDINPKDRFAVVSPPGEAASSHFTAVPPASEETPAEREGPATPPNGIDGQSTGPDPAARLPQGFTPVEGTPLTESGLPLRIVCDLDGAEMVLIEAGVFRQGRDQNEDEQRDGVQSIPERAVYLDDFYIDVYEVTLDRFAKYRKAAEKDDRRLPPEPLNAGAAGDQPAAGIPWAQAKGYATWSGRTLPTEAQWDKAARTSKSFTHPWGNGRAIWGKPRVPGRLDPVGSFPSDQTPQGVFDMAGNVREWCLDNYSDSFKKVSASEVVKNPDGPREPSLKYHRVIKGGGPGWIVWHRTSAPMRTVEPDLGFRTVLPIAPGKAQADDKKPGTTGKVGF